VQQLFSKLIAGGLSAAVILLWWPLVFPSTTVESWMIRGIVWTASFELMLLAFLPVEEALWRSRAARRVRDTAAAAGGKLVADSPRRKHGSRSIVAGIAVCVPLVLLATAPAHPLDPKPATEQVRHVTEVKRVVRVETKRVKVPQQLASAAVAPRSGAATTSKPARSAAPFARRTTGRTTPRRSSPGSSSERGTRSAPAGPRSADPPAATDQGSSGAQQPSGADSPATPE
jgi:hypothetical protein